MQIQSYMSYGIAALAVLASFSPANAQELNADSARKRINDALRAIKETPAVCVRGKWYESWTDAPGHCGSNAIYKLNDKIWLEVIDPPHHPDQSLEEEKEKLRRMAEIMGTDLPEMEVFDGKWFYSFIPFRLELSIQPGRPENVHDRGLLPSNWIKQHPSLPSSLLSFVESKQLPSEVELLADGRWKLWRKDIHSHFPAQLHPLLPKEKETLFDPASGFLPVEAYCLHGCGDEYFSKWEWSQREERWVLEHATFDVKSPSLSGGKKRAVELTIEEVSFDPRKCLKPFDQVEAMMPLGTAIRRYDDRGKLTKLYYKGGEEGEQEHRLRKAALVPVHASVEGGALSRRTSMDEIQRYVRQYTRRAGVATFVAIALLSSGEIAAAQQPLPAGSNLVAPDPDCGAKCLYVALRQLGAGPATYEELRRHLGRPSKDGYSLLQLRDAAGHYGLHSEGLQLDREDLESFSVDQCVMLHLNPGHFVLLDRIQGDQVRVFEPAMGSIMCRPADLLNEWSGTVLVIAREPVSLKQRQRRGVPLAMAVALVGVVIGCLVFLARRQLRNRMAVILLLVMNTSLLGCSGDDVSRSSALPGSSETRAVAGQNLPQEGSTASGPVKDASPYWFVSGDLAVPQQRWEIGDLPMNQPWHIVKVPIRNMGTESHTIADTRISCSCLRVRTVSPVIPPGEEQQVEFLLDCRKPGLSAAACTVLLDSGEQIPLEFSWRAVRRITVEPDSLGVIELAPGGQHTVHVSVRPEDETADADLLQHLRVECRWMSPPEIAKAGLEFVAEHESAGQFEVSFRVGEGTTKVFLRGSVDVVNEVDGQMLAHIPVSLVVRPPLVIQPQSLTLVRRGDQWVADVIVETETPEAMAQLPDPRCTWIGERAPECEPMITRVGSFQIVTVGAPADKAAAITALRLQFDDKVYEIPVTRAESRSAD